MSEIDISSYASAMAEALEEVKNDFEDRINSLQNVVESIGWFGVAPSLFMEEVGEVTFSSLEGAASLVKDIEFSPVPTQDLLEDYADKRNDHVFESPSLDAAENKLIGILRNAGTGALKELSGAMVPADFQSALIAGQEAKDQAEANRQLNILNRFQTPDLAGNQAWLSLRHQYKSEDRKRDIFATLFELAQENVRWAQKAGIGIEAAHASFTASYSSIVFNLTKANIAAYKADVEANIAELEANLRHLKSELELEALRLDRESTEWGLKIKQANNRLQEYSRNYTSVLNANLNMLNARIAGGKNVADAYRAIFGAYSHQFTAVSMQGGDV